MKEGWKYVKLGEVCEILDSRRKPITKSKRETGNIPYYGATGLLDYVKDFIFDEPLVLLGEDGAKWGAGELSAYRINGKSWVNNHAHVLRPKRDITNDYWLIYFLNYSDLQEYIMGVTVPKLNQEKMRSITIPLLPLSEQESIVARLDSSFAKIDAVKAKAEKSLDEAKALFQSALTEMMKPKEGWEEKKLGEICDFVRGPFGGSLKKECFKNCGYAIYEQQNAIYNKFTFRYFINEEKYQSLIRFKVNSGDLIISCSGTIGKVAIVPENHKEGIINQALLKLTPRKVIKAFFLKYLMESNYFSKIINANTEGVAIKNIASVAVLKKLPIPLPPLSEQESIVARLDAMSEKVKLLEAIYNKTVAECDALKQAILREIFN